MQNTYSFSSIYLCSKFQFLLFPSVFVDSRLNSIFDSVVFECSVNGKLMRNLCTHSPFRYADFVMNYWNNWSIVHCLFSRHRINKYNETANDIYSWSERYIDARDTPLYTSMTLNWCIKWFVSNWIYRRIGNEHTFTAIGSTSGHVDHSNKKKIAGHAVDLLECTATQ